MRSDRNAPLDAAVDGPGAATVYADEPFRLRMVATPAAAERALRLGVRRNAGPWTPVEAHDFPLPERELVLRFDGAEPLQGWRASGGAALDVRQGAGLEMSAASQPGLALYSAPWPLDAFGLAAELFIPEAATGAAALVFDYAGPGDHTRLELDAAEGALRLIRIEDGAARELAAAAAPAPRGRWIVLEVGREDGVLSADFDEGAVRLELADRAPRAFTHVGLHAGAGGAMQLRSLEIAGEAATPRVSVVSSDAYAHGAQTAPLLAAAGRGEAAAGVAVSLEPSTPAFSNPGPADVVWPLVIRRFADAAAFNEAGDTFEFRMVDMAGRSAGAGDNPVVRLDVRPAHLGGTYVETPGRTGPWRASDGALFFIMEPTETDNLFMMVRSDDDGRGWRETDGANRPATGDLESVDARRVGDTIHILHQITEGVLHHAFQLPGEETEGGWLFTDAPVAELEAVSQMATLAARPDGGLVAVFLGDRLFYAERPAGGAWSAPAVLDPEADAMTVGPQAVAGGDGAVHIAYADTDGALWHRRLGPDGALSDRIRLATGAVTGEDDYGAVTPLAYLAETQTLVVAYRLADGSLWERRSTRGGAFTDPVRITPGPVITNAVDSQQAGADLVAAGGGLHALFIDADTRAILHSADCGAGWTTPRVLEDAINGSWVRAVALDGADGERLAYTYDAGSNGGAGLNRYAVLPDAPCE
ncbi:hypothetical protein AY599_03200 [Leptolyngbya valderiana BDU 20041]|nr:hypothetical protein AY599_03200 [Leptolyngbya valderiana BDU 20041]